MQNMQAPLGGTVGASITIKIKKKKIVKLVESKTAVAKKSKRVLL